MGILLILLVFLGLAAALALWAMGIYNGLVTSRNGWKNAFAQIDVQLQRRFDLIPNLVETAKAYMGHERETLEAVIAARSAAQSGLAAAKAHPGDADAMAQLAAKTEPAEFKDRNPHASHLGEIDCTVCHKAHGPSKIYCLGCHQKFVMTIPGGTPAKGGN